MKRLAAVSVLFSALFLAFIFSTESIQTVLGFTQTQQQKQDKKSGQKDPVADVLKKSLVPDDIDLEGVSFKATAYCLRGRTASGAMVRKGIIAADPRVLPLGSNVTILKGPYAGDYLVADTGGKIKGNRIDIWMASCSEAMRFGVRSVLLQVPERENG
jgi:3D (Asp-Asp-Asp) domain-containing protein